MNLGASFAYSTGASAGMSSPFTVTGGGGSSAQSTGAKSPISGTGQATGVSAWLPWLVVGLVAVGFLIFFMKGR